MSFPTVRVRNPAGRWCIVRQFAEVSASLGGVEYTFPVTVALEATGKEQHVSQGWWVIEPNTGRYVARFDRSAVEGRYTVAKITEAAECALYDRVRAIGELVFKAKIDEVRGEG